MSTIIAIIRSFFFACGGAFSARLSVAKDRPKAVFCEMGLFAWRAFRQESVSGSSESIFSRKIP